MKEAMPKIKEITHIEFPSRTSNFVSRKKRKAYRFWSWVAIVSFIAFMFALSFFHYQVLMPALSAMSETAYAGEPCDDPDRYINREEAKAWCYELVD